MCHVCDLFIGDEVKNPDEHPLSVEIPSYLPDVVCDFSDGILDMVPFWLSPVARMLLADLMKMYVI